jgi:hypothetical protein
MMLAVVDERILVVLRHWHPGHISDARMVGSCLDLVPDVPR